MTAMMELFKTALRLPFATMTGLSEVFLGSLRQMQHAVDSGLADINARSRGDFSANRSRENHLHVAETQKSFVDLPSLEPCSPKINVTQLPVNPSSEGPQMSYDKPDSEFFSDRKYVKTYELTITYVGESDEQVLQPQTLDRTPPAAPTGDPVNDKLRTTQDTDKKCLENDHRGAIARAIRASTSASQLPLPWNTNPPNFLTFPGGGRPVVIDPQVNADFDDNIKATVQPVSRHLVVATQNDRRQSKALEGIAEAIGEIREQGLKTREY